jgi:hypothetical protein
MDRSDVAAVGGPNLPPISDPMMAQAVARAPGGPAHVLLTDDRAEHIPGCNMAFWREALIGVGGFDPIYTAAGDDVDLCWRLMDRDQAIAFHPAAVVWHHRRGGRRAYLRQQRGYGHAETLVASRHPDRFNGLGGARWRGALYSGFPPLLTGEPIYRGRFGTAAFQSVYRSRAHGLDLAHQAGVPVAVAMLPLAVSPLGAIRVVGLAALALLAGLFVVDAVMTRPPRRGSRLNLRFRAEVAAFFVLQPLARLAGRLASVDEIAPSAASTAWIPAETVSRKRTTVIISTAARRDEIMEKLVRTLREARVRVVAPTGWEEYDCRALPSALVAGDVISSSHVLGTVQITVRPRLRTGPAVVFGLLAAIGAVAAPAASLLVLGAAAVELVRGLWTTRSVMPAMVVKAVGLARPEPAAGAEMAMKESRQVREPAQRAT